jgi:hypothetical protein
LNFFKLKDPFNQTRVCPVFPEWAGFAETKYQRTQMRNGEDFKKIVIILRF